MKNIYETLEFSTIKSAIKNYCVSVDAKEVIDYLTPINELDELIKMQEYQKEALYLLFNYSKVPFSYYENIDKILAKANKDGTLFGEDFIKIIYQLNNVREILAYLTNNEIIESKLSLLMKELYLPKDLLNHINKCIDATGYVLDGASSELKRIRRQILSLEANIRVKIEQIKTAHKDMLSQETIASRNEHLVLPVKAGHKNQVKGIVHSLSSSGQTMFIEPEAIVQINNQLVSVKEEEKREIQRILFALSQEVKINFDSLMYNQKCLIELDVIFAKASYGLKIDGVIPTITTNMHNLVLKKARHPLIDSKVVVSNDIEIVDPKSMLIISGSNTGGKTVVLKTVGLLSLMGLSGLAVPCFEATIPMFDNIFVDLGDEQSIEQSLSTFSSHMKRLVEITNEVTSSSLVLLDEIGSGTDPREGQSIAEALLKYLHDKDTLTVASTHYSGLKQFAKNEDYIIVSAVEFDQENMRPTYRLIEGSVGNSYAIEISQRLGLNMSIVNDAYQIKENSLSESDKLLEKLQSELNSVQIEKDKLEALTKEADYKLNKYNRQLDVLEKQKADVLLSAKNDANKILEAAKAKVDLVVEELRQQSELKQHVVIDAKRYLDLSQHQAENVKKVNEIDHNYQIGDRVKVLSVNREGEVININKKGILTIDMGGLKLNAKKNEISFIEKKVKIKPIKSNLKPIKKTTSQGYEINVIGERYEEAMMLVDKFLDDAIVQNFSMVRIVHGMGTGVLRNGIRKMLDKNKNIVSYRDGGPNEGGLGATLVYFE